jgi:hypothetical protein
VASMIDDILPRLSKIKPTKPSHWLACCPSHQDKNASLAITELNDGRVLLKCWAGCTAKEITNAVGLTMRCLYPQEPDPNTTTSTANKTPAVNVWEKRKLLSQLNKEQLIVAIYESAIRKGESISEENENRALLAAITSRRINKLLNAYDRKGEYISNSRQKSSLQRGTN